MASTAPGPGAGDGMDIIKKLNECASVTMNADFGLQLWYRTASQTIKQAVALDREHESTKAYVLYMRFVTLVLQELPRHPNYGDPATTRQQQAFRKKCSDVLDRLEALKGKIRQEYAEAARKRAQEQAEADAAAERVSTRVVLVVRVCVSKGRLFLAHMSPFVRVPAAA